MRNNYPTTGGSTGQDEIHSITATAQPHTQDMGHRMKVYATQMGMRVVCLIVFVVVDNFWVRAVALVGVAVLPWVAVLLANSGADRSARTSHYYEPPDGPALPAAPEPERSAPPLAIEYVMEGEFVAGHGEDDGTAPPDPAPGAADSSERPGPSDTVGDGPRARNRPTPPRR